MEWTMYYRIIFYMLILAAWLELACRGLPILVAPPAHFNSLGLGVIVAAVAIVSVLIATMAWDLRRCRPWTQPPPGLSTASFWLSFYLVGAFSGNAAVWMERHLRSRLSTSWEKDSTPDSRL